MVLAHGDWAAAGVGFLFRVGRVDRKPQVPDPGLPV